VHVTPQALPGPATRPAECPVDVSIACDAVAQLLIRPTTRNCFHFDVRNIALPSPTTIPIPIAAPGATTVPITAVRPAGWNNLQVYLGEVPKLGPHVQAFCEVLEHAAGLPPDGVTDLSSRTRA
jgi:hypothetical protein